MTSERNQTLHHPGVAFVDRHVYGGLPPLVSRVHVATRCHQLLEQRGLVSKRGMMHGPVAIFVLSRNIFIINDVIALRIVIYFPFKVGRVEWKQPSLIQAICFGEKNPSNS